MIVIKDYKPPSLNKVYREHWSKRRVEGDKVKWLVKEVMKGDWKYAPYAFVEPVTLEFKIYVKDKRKHDVDNFAVKDLIDGLVDCGVLEDDCDKYVKKVSKEIIRSDENKVEIRIK